MLHINTVAKRRFYFKDSYQGGQEHLMNPLFQMYNMIYNSGVRGSDEDALMMDFEYEDDGSLDDQFSKYLNSDAPY